MDAFLHHPSLALIHLFFLHASRLAAVSIALHLVVLARSYSSSSTSSSSFSVSGLVFLLAPLLSLSSLLLLLTTYLPKDFMVFGSSQDYLTIGINLLALTPILTCIFLLSKRHGLGGGARVSLPGVQMFRHTLLLMGLSVGMFTSVALAVGRLVIHDENYPGAFKVLICANSILSSGQGILFLAVFGLDKAGLLLAIGQKLIKKLGLPSFADTTNNFVLVSEEKREHFIKFTEAMINPVRGTQKSLPLDGGFPTLPSAHSELDPVKVSAIVEKTLKRGEESSQMERSV